MEHEGINASSKYTLAKRAGPWPCGGGNKDRIRESAGDQAVVWSSVHSTTVQPNGDPGREPSKRSKYGLLTIKGSKKKKEVDSGSV